MTEGWRHCLSRKTSVTGRCVDQTRSRVWAGRGGASSPLAPEHPPKGEGFGQGRSEAASGLADPLVLSATNSKSIRNAMMPSTFGMCRIAAAAVLRSRGRNGALPAAGSIRAGDRCCLQRCRGIAVADRPRQIPPGAAPTQRRDREGLCIGRGCQPRGQLCCHPGR